MVQSDVYNRNLTEKERDAELGKQVRMQQTAQDAVQRVAPNIYQQGAQEGMALTLAELDRRNQELQAMEQMRQMEASKLQPNRRIAPEMTGLAGQGVQR